MHGISDPDPRAHAAGARPVFTTAALVALVALGESDCEAFETGPFVQTTNTATSVAYIVIGLALIVDALRRSHKTGPGASPDPDAAPATRITFGLALVAVGVGSVLFHGPGWPASRWLHDVSILAAFGLIAAHSLGLALRWSSTKSLAVFAVGLAALGGVIAAVPDSSIALTGLVALLAVVAEVAAWRRGCRLDNGRFAGPAYWLALGLLAAATAVNLASRTGGPLCRPDDWLQGHGAWHVMTALAFGAWAIDGLSRRRPGP
jgi:hypothetical protein